MKKLYPILFVLFLLLPNLTHAAFPAGAVAYWRLDESSGDAVDAVVGGSTNLMVNTNSCTYATGLINNAVSLASASSQRLNIASGSQTNLDFTNSDFTVAGWVKFTTFNGDSTPIAHGDAEPNEQFALDLYLNGGTDIHFFGRTYYSGSGKVTIDRDAGNLSTGVWYHVAYTTSLSGNNNRIRIYKDGVQLGADVTYNQAANFTATANFALGCEGTAGACLNGLLDEWGVWNRELTAAEISTLYNAGVGLTYPSVSVASIFYAFMQLF